jgi:hypothetical protein
VKSKEEDLVSITSKNSDSVLGCYTLFQLKPFRLKYCIIVWTFGGGPEQICKH